MGLRTDIPSASTPKGAALTTTVAFSPTTEGPAAPVGGTGATAGAYDTAGNRDLAIVLINENRTRVEEAVVQITNLKARLDELEQRLDSSGGHGLIP